MKKKGGGLWPTQKIYKEGVLIKGANPLKNLKKIIRRGGVLLFRTEEHTLPSVLEEGYLIEEGGLAKFKKRYKRGVIFL